MHPTKALPHEFLATCIDVDVEKSVKYRLGSGLGYLLTNIVVLNKNG